MRYLGRDWVAGVLISNDFELLKEIINDCIKTVYSWDKEFHDYKDITADVLSRYESRLNAVMHNKCKEMGISVGGNNPWDYCFPGPGRDRTRMYKYFLSYILDEIYREDERFKYYLKYNGGDGKAARPRILRIYKDSKRNTINKKNLDNNHLLSECIGYLSVVYQLWERGCRDNRCKGYFGARQRPPVSQ